MTFRVGQKVVCVDDNPRNHPDWRASDHPVKWRVYTLRWVGPSLISQTPSVMLEEIFGGWFRDGVEYVFQADRFRPIVEKKTDISIFTAMLNPKKARERA